MKSYGHINMNNNQVQKMALQEELNFPSPPVTGRVVFKDKRVWICVEIVADVPAWVPLTGMNNTKIHEQSSAATTWTITHNLNTTSPLVQVYDNSGNMLIPNSIIPTSNNIVEINFGNAMTGRAVFMFGDISVYPTV